MGNDDEHAPLKMGLAFDCAQSSLDLANLLEDGKASARATVHVTTRKIGASKRPDSVRQSSTETPESFGQDDACVEDVFLQDALEGRCRFRSRPTEKGFLILLSRGRYDTRIEHLVAFDNCSPSAISHCCLPPTIWLAEEDAQKVVRIAVSGELNVVSLFT